MSSKITTLNILVPTYIPIKWFIEVDDRLGLHPHFKGMEEGYMVFTYENMDIEDLYWLSNDLRWAESYFRQKDT